MILYYIFEYKSKLIAHFIRYIYLSYDQKRLQITEDEQMNRLSKPSFMCTITDCNAFVATIYQPYCSKILLSLIHLIHLY